MKAGQIKPKALGSPADNGRAQWVQTERSAHEAWARLSVRSPRAAALLHVLVARMGAQNAVVITQKTLAAMLGCTDRTVRTAVKELVDENWVQIVKLGGLGAAAYVVNSNVGWTQRRDELCTAIFTATVVADRADQDEKTLEHKALRRIPVLYAGEQQLPTGPGEDPPAQPSLDGMEPDLPALFDN